MPNAQNKPKIDARRFAALLAGFDTGNGSEEEAIAKVRALRRMAEAAGMRVVDVMELPEVKQAIDDQMGPKRQESPALREALEQAAAMQEELTERTRNVRELAERLRQQEERTEALNRELRAARSARTAPPQEFTTPRPTPVVASPAPRTLSHSQSFDWRSIPLPNFEDIYIPMGLGLGALALIELVVHIFF